MNNMNDMIVDNKIMLKLISKKLYHLSMQGPVNKYYDIAANLTDHQFSGSYYGKHQHGDDRHEVIKRARQHGVQHLLIAAGNLEDAHHSYQMCQKYPNCYATIGVHPCRAKEPHHKNKWGSVKEYFEEIDRVIDKIRPHLVAIGECGLDYDRLQWSTKQQQLQVFPYHFQLAQKHKLPMYLHNRNTGNDFFQIVRKNRDRFTTGVVHSFTGTKQELQTILELDLYVGVNGCSLKTADNLDVLREIPLDRMMLETDCPYCEIRNSHASSQFVKTKFKSKPKDKKREEGMLVKGRNQPCKIVEVAEVVSSVLGCSLEELTKTCYANSMKILGPVPK